MAGGTARPWPPKQATKTIPIVFAAVVDPVADGLVASLARPGGNVTGLSVLAPELVGKWLELLKQAVPGVSRVAVLWHPGTLGERTEKDMLKGQRSRRGRWGCGFKSLRREGPRISTGRSRT